MKRILFLVLWIISVSGPQAQGAIVIYANGHEYDSLQAYQASKKSAAAGSPLAPVPLNSQEENDIRQEAQRLGIEVDFSRVKTFKVNQKDLSSIALHKLYVHSVESGIVNALQDFYQTSGQSDFHMITKASSEQLQEAIQQAVITSKDPKLLISTPGKVRIMAISPDHSKQ